MYFSLCKVFALLRALAPAPDPGVDDPGPGEPQGVPTFAATRHLITRLTRLVSWVWIGCWIYSENKNPAHPAALRDQGRFSLVGGRAERPLWPLSPHPTFWLVRFSLQSAVHQQGDHAVVPPPRAAPGGGEVHARHRCVELRVSPRAAAVQTWVKYVIVLYWNACLCSVDLAWCNWTNQKDQMVGFAIFLNI